MNLSLSLLAYSIFSFFLASPLFSAADDIAIFSSFYHGGKTLIQVPNSIWNAQPKINLWESGDFLPVSGAIKKLTGALVAENRKELKGLRLYSVALQANWVAIEPRSIHLGKYYYLCKMLPSTSDSIEESSRSIYAAVLLTGEVFFAKELVVEKETVEEKGGAERVK